MSNTARIDALETRLARLEDGIDRLLAVLEPAAPAKVTRPKAAPKARKAAAKPQVKALTCLVKDNRARFIAAHAWAKAGMSTLDLAIAVVHLAQPVTGGWDLGEGYEAKARTATKAAIADVRKMLAA